LRSAQAQLQSAKSTLDSLMSPRAELVIKAQTQLEQARLSVEQAKQNLAAATIVAPFDGVIIAVNVTAVGRGSSDAIELADNSQLHVDVLVDETEVASVASGQKVELTLDALTGITLTGQVAHIDPVGTVSNGVVNYNVRVNLEPTAAPLRLDMTANASIIGEQHADVLAVPTAAIRTMSNGQDTSGTPTGQTASNTPSNFVLVLNNGQTHRVPVTVGMTSGDLTEVSGALKEGDQVLVSAATSTSNSTNNNQGGDFPLGGPPDGGAGGPPPF
jgi:RND family efflux transporter MFP subunit